MYSSITRGWQIWRYVSDGFEDMYLIICPSFHWFCFLYILRKRVGLGLIKNDRWIWTIGFKIFSYDILVRPVFDNHLDFEICFYFLKFLYDDFLFCLKPKTETNFYKLFFFYLKFWLESWKHFQKVDYTKIRKFMDESSILKFSF